MKQFKWPRPPLILGVVLGDTIERYMFISVERYGLSWLLRPVVAILFTMAIIGLVRPLWQDIRRQGGLRKMLRSFQAPTFHPSQLFTMFMIALIGTALLVASRWDFSAKIVPIVIGTTGLLMAALSLFNDMCRKPTAPRAEGLAEQAQHEVEGTIHEKIHMDLTSDTAHLPVREIVLGAARFFGYLIAFMAVMWLIGLIPTVALLRAALHALGRAGTLVAGHPLCGRSWCSASTSCSTMFMAVPWPPTLLGQWFPAMKFIPSV